MPISYLRQLPTTAVFGRARVVGRFTSKHSDVQPERARASSALRYTIAKSDCCSICISRTLCQVSAECYWASSTTSDRDPSSIQSGNSVGRYSFGSVS